MMKRSVVFLAMLALVATSAFGSSIVMLPTIGTQTGATTGSFAYSISEDGKYVGGRVTDTDGVYSPAIYNLTTSSWSVVPPTSGTVVGSGNVNGVAHRATSSMVYAGINQADNGTRSYATSNQFGRGYKGGTVYGLSPGSETMVASCSESSSAGYSGGGAASFADGSDAWIAAQHSQGSTNRGAQAYLYKASDGGTAWATLTSGRNGSKFTTNGVAGTGRVVGWDFPTTGNNVKSGSYWDGAAGGTITAVTEIPHVPAFKTGASWYGYGVSDNGQYAVGYQNITTVTRVQAFLADLNAGTAVVLNTGHGPSANEQAVAYDVTSDGFAIGYEYESTRVPTYMAVAWLPWDSTHTAITLMDLAYQYGANLSGWTSLGFGGASVTKVGGSYIIAGNGMYNGEQRAFVLTIPEPATLAFLALGGLAMLRRRR